MAILYKNFIITEYKKGILKKKLIAILTEIEIIIKGWGWNVLYEKMTGGDGKLIIKEK